MNTWQVVGDGDGGLRVFATARAHLQDQSVPAIKEGRRFSLGGEQFICERLLGEGGFAKANAAFCEYRHARSFLQVFKCENDKGFVALKVRTRAESKRKVSRFFSIKFRLVRTKHILLPRYKMRCPRRCVNTLCHFKTLTFSGTRAQSFINGRRLERCLWVELSRAAKTDIANNAYRISQTRID